MSGTGVRPRRSWRFTRRARVLAVLIILLLFIGHVIQLTGIGLPSRNSFLVLEAVSRANDDPQTTALLGKPVMVGWTVWGYMYPTAARLWIPVVGPNGKGLLHARLGWGSGPWVFSELKLSIRNKKIIDLLQRHRSPGVIISQPHVGTYLVPLGDVRSVDLQELPEFYRTNFGLDVQLLAPLPLEPSAFDTARRQFIAEELVALMERHLPRLAKDKTSVLIGITDQDMYIRGFDWRFAFNYRERLRFAVVSGARFGKKENVLKARVRKSVTRNIGLLVYRFPMNHDPTSPLYRELWGTYDIDLASDWFEGLGARAVVSGFREAHGQASLTPELPTDDQVITKADGKYPCLVFKKPTEEEARIFSFRTAGITQCLPRALMDVDVDEIEIDLRSGLLVTRRTDLFIGDVIPLVLTRCYRLWDERPLPFGVNTNHVWDMNPTGSRQPYTDIDVHLCDGSTLHFDRISKGTGYADAVYEHRQTTTPFLGARFSWNGNGWNLRLRDGTLLLFPEAYFATRPVEGSIFGMRDAKGRNVQVARDRRRNLKRITSPGGHFISFELDAGDRIIKASDDQKRTVNYTYDAGGRLVLVEGPQRATRYRYDRSDLLEIEEEGRRLVQFRYFEGRPAQISFADGRSYRLRFKVDPRDEQRVVQTTLTSPDGSQTTLDIKTK